MNILPSVGVATNPLIGLRPQDMRIGPVGVPIRELAPKTDALVICRYNGEWLLREHWSELTTQTYVLEFYELPQDRDTLRGVLQIAVILFAVTNPYVWGSLGLLAFSVGATLAINALLPPTPLQNNSVDQAAASPTYTTSLTGNTARLYQPIPKVCGRMQVVPPFAAQPYFEFSPYVEDTGGDQFYYAVFAVGVGNYEIERALIDDTDISHFADVLVAQYLAPGVQPSRALANVSTAIEVSGQDMLTYKVIGGFAACSPKQKAVSIGVDIVAPKGLAYSNDDGSLGDLSLSWNVETRVINDWGAPQTNWAILASETRTAHTNTPQRWTNKYVLSSPDRIEVRVYRTDERNESIRALHDIQWVGLRAYLDEDAPLNAETAHFEVVMRASEQLSAISQRQIKLIVKGLVRTWNPDTGWGDEVHTRNPAWWLADLWTNAIWGEGLPDSRVDLQTLYDLSLIWETRQDRFDNVFDTSTDAWAAAQTIARAGRARPFRRFGVNTLARDALIDLPVTAFTPRNCIPSSMVMTEILPQRDTPDGYIIEYFDNRAWSWLTIECPCPSVDEMTNPITMRLAGITGPIHAEREGRYEAAALIYRPRTVACSTEMQGMLVNYMAPARWQPLIQGYGKAGDVVDYDEDSLSVTLSEAVTFTGSDYITFIRDDGSLTTPALVTAGSSEFQVVLPAVPDFTVAFQESAREPTKFLFGPLETGDELVKVMGITDGGKSDEGAQLFNITALVDDDRVHTADNDLLPVGDEIQDPVDLPGLVDDSDVGPPRVVNITDQTLLVELAEPGAAYWLGADGGVRTRQFVGDTWLPISNQWLTAWPVDSDVDTSNWEVRATEQVLSGSSTGPAFDSWFPLDTDRIWTLTSSPGILQFLVEIRDADTEVVLASAQITLNNYAPT